MGIGRQILGEMKRFMRLSKIQTHTWRKTLRNGVVIAVMSIAAGEGMADIDKVLIAAPEGLGGVHVYGYIIESANMIKVETPSGKEAGRLAKDDNDRSFIGMTPSDTTYEGYPDYNSKWLGMDSYQPKPGDPSVTVTPEFEQVFMAYYGTTRTFSQYPRPDDWETTYPYWPPPEDTPAPTQDDNYEENAMFLYKRVDEHGMWFTEGFNEDNTSYYEIEAATTISVPSSEKSESTRRYGETLFMVPMKGDSLKFALWSYSYSDPAYNYPAVENGPFLYQIKQGTDGNWYNMLNATDTTYASVNPGRFGIDINVEDGPHKVSCLAGRRTYVRVTLFTSMGKIVKKINFADTAPSDPPYDETNDPYNYTYAELFRINVGAVRSAEEIVIVTSPQGTLPFPF